MKEKTQPIENKKKYYKSPHLTYYGEVRSITQAGTMGGTESTSMSADMMA